MVKGINDAIAADTALDGELVAFDDAGLPSFNALQNATPKTIIVFFAFDVLVSEGEDVKMLPLRAEKNCSAGFYKQMGTSSFQSISADRWPSSSKASRR